MKLEVTSYDVTKYSTPCNFVIFADRNTRLLFLRSWYVSDFISWNRKWRHMTSSNIQTPVTLLFLQIETRDFYFWGPGMFTWFYFLKPEVTSHDVIKYSNPCNFVIFADRNTRLLFLWSWWFWFNFTKPEVTSYDVRKYSTPCNFVIFADTNMRRLFLWSWYVSWFNFTKPEVTSYDVIKYSNPCNLVIFAYRDKGVSFMGHWHPPNLISLNWKWRHDNIWTQEWH